MRLALQELRRRPRRTALTAAGVAAGACAYILLVGSAEGLLRQFHAVTAFFGAEFVIQQAGATSPWGSALPDPDVEALRRVRGVARVSRIGLGKTRLIGTPYFLVFGLDPAEPLMGRIPVRAGRVPRRGADEMLLGDQAAARLRTGVMQTVDVRGRRLTVTGIYRTGHAVLDAGGVLDLGVTQRLFNLHEAVNLAFVDLTGEVGADVVAAGISRALPGVDAMRARGWGESYGQFRMIEDFAHLIAGLAVLIAALCVSNVLQTSVGERNGEIAVLRAIGWSRRRVAGLVLIETLAVTLLGVLVAVLSSELILSFVSSARVGSTYTAAFLPAHVSVELFTEALAVSVVAGLLGTVAPLIRAVRIRPADALRRASGA